MTTGFHDDRTPSLQLYDDGTWYCYGACQTGGSLYDFASRLWGIATKGLSFLELRDRLVQELLPLRSEKTCVSPKVLATTVPLRSTDVRDPNAP